MNAMTPVQVRALPAVLDVATTAQALGCSAWTVRQMHARGEIRALRLGRLLRFRLVDVLELLGLTPDTSEPPGHHPEGTAATDSETLEVPSRVHDARPLRAVNPS